MRISSIALLSVTVASCSEQSGNEYPGAQQLIEEQRIGAIDTPDALTRIGAVAVANDRSLVFVGQPQEATVKIFRADGKHLRTIGGRGQGPGEFSSPGALGIALDTLWVLDDITGRLTYFNIAGDLLGTFSLPAAEIDGLLVRGAGIPLRTGAYLAVGFGVRGSPAGKTRVPIVTRARDGSIIDSLALITLPEKGMMKVGGPGRGSLGALNLPLRDGSVFASLPDGLGIVVAEEAPSGNAYHVTRITAAGDTTMVAPLPFTSIPVSAAYVDSIADLLFRLVPNAPFTKDDIRTALRRFEHFPPVTRVVPGIDGVIWIRREDLGTDSVTWEVLRADGVRWFGTRLGRSTEIRWARADTAWAMILDSLDVPYLVRLRPR